jgi:flagellar basal-body rod protein FlgB
MFATKAIFALKQSLNGLAERQRVIAGNIANVDTPGYKAKAVDFEQQLNEALSRTRQIGPGGGRMSDISPTVTYDYAATVRNDGNNVDVDLQMAEMAETSLRYEAASQMLAKKYSLLRDIITEGRR